MTTPRKYFWQHDLDARDPEPGKPRRVIRRKCADGLPSYLLITSAMPTNQGTKSESWFWQAVHVRSPYEATHFSEDLAGLEAFILKRDELGRPTNPNRTLEHVLPLSSQAA